MDLRCADDFPSACHQHLSARLDHQAELQQFPCQPSKRRCQVDRTAQLRAHTDRQRHLADDAGDSAFPHLDAAASGSPGLRPGVAHQPEVQGQRSLDVRHRSADDAVTGRRGELLDLPVSTADRPLQLRRRIPDRNGSHQLLHDRRCGTCPLVNRHRGHLDVDAVRHAHLPCRAPVHTGFDL